MKTGAVPLLAFDVHSPLTRDDLLAGDLRTAALAGTIALAKLPAVGEPPPVVQAKPLLAVFGRHDVSAGTLAGTIQIDGTIGVPTAVAAITAYDVTIPASVEGRKPAHAHRSRDPRPAGTARADSSTCSATSRRPRSCTSPRTAGPISSRRSRRTFEATKLDIAPFAAFAPGPLVAAKGTLTSSLTLHGLDPDTGDLDGKIVLENGRVPLHDLIGTLRNANLDVEIAEPHGHRAAQGQARSRRRRRQGDVALTGSTPKTADMTLR